MRTNSTPRLLLPGLAAVGLGLCVAIYYPSENPISGPGAAALYAIAIVAIFLCGWEMRAIRLPKTRKHCDNSVGASGFMNFDAFATFANTALDASNQVSRAVMVINIDRIVATDDPLARAGRVPIIDLDDTIRDAFDVGANSVATRMVDGGYAVLVSSRTSDQVLAMAEKILAVATGDEQVRISIGICFCLPSSTSAFALQIARDALRLAQKNSVSAWRSIAEGGSREVTRRSVRAPTLARSSSSAVDR